MEENKLSLNIKELDFEVKEAIKSLRTNLMYSGEFQSVLVTSSTAGEGKSTVALQLAKSFAELGKRTVLVDCDLRKSMLTGRYGISNDLPGLSELLSGQAKKVVYATNVPELYMVLSGQVPPNPQELLASGKFAAFIDAMEKSCDYVILDAPPVANVSDALVVGQQADGTLLVVRNDFVKKALVKNVKRQILQSGGRIFGVVLNRVKKSQKDYYYKHYGYNQ